MGKVLPSLAGVVLRLIGIVFLFTAACATHSPEPYNPIHDGDFQGPSLARVRSDAQAFVGASARWGGNITRVENRSDETLIEIVEHELQYNGRPRTTNTSGGRFIARITGFVDPAIFAQGRQLTVVGTVAPAVQSKIGEHDYTFPIVSVEQYQLWQQQRQRDIVYYPYFYGGPAFNCFNSLPYWHPWGCW